MKLLTDDVKKQIVWKALVKADGDREKAAEILGVSRRTLFRYLGELDLYPSIDEMGWSQKPGPPRGVSAGTSVIRLRIIAHVRAHHGEIDYGELASEIYGEDTPVMRQRIYSALEALKNQGRLSFDGETWVELDPLTKKPHVNA